MESNMSRLDKSLKDMLDFSLCPFIPRFQLGKDYAPFLWAWASGASERYLVTDSSDHEFDLCSCGFLVYRL